MYVVTTGLPLRLRRTWWTVTRDLLSHWYASAAHVRNIPGHNPPRQCMLRRDEGFFAAGDGDPGYSSKKLSVSVI
jgi:hypothetical protein